MFEFSNIVKEFPGLRAVDDVSISLKAGEIHAIIGENGAGKSSLIKVACGLYTPESGTMTLDGEPYVPHGPSDALAAGVRVVHQEFSLMPSLSVAENLAIEDLPQRKGIVDRAKMLEEAQKLMNEVGLDIDPKIPVGHLGIAHQQLVEIARSVRSDSRVLILDEPTATLTPPEVERLFTIIRRLRDRGVAIVLVTHHLDEIFEVADRVTVLRNGQHAGTELIDNIDTAGLVKLMIGRDVDEVKNLRIEKKLGNKRLVVKDLLVEGAPEPVSFSVSAGEILGFAGLVGSGRTEMVRALFGADQMISGQISVDGKEVTIKDPASAVDEGIGLLTEDRKGEGLLLDLSCNTNMTIASLGKVSKRTLMNFGGEKKAGSELVKRLGIRKPPSDIDVRYLSGGNQQKVVLAKWLFRDGRVLIFDEPTRGVDVGAKFEIYQLLNELSARGIAIVVVSSDLPELLAVCDRIGVFSRREIVGFLEHEEFSKERILELAYANYTQKSGEQTPTPSIGESK